MKSRFVAQYCLVCVLITSLFFLATCAMNASSDDSSKYTVYYYNENSWTNVYSYAWTGTTKYLGDWPGKPMKNEGDKWFSIIVSGTTASDIIFNSGSGGSQTSDLHCSGNSSYYKGSWYDGDFRASPPSICVDFGSVDAPYPVLAASSMPLTVEIAPSSGLTAASVCEFKNKQDGLAIGPAINLSSGKAIIDLSAKMSSLSDGDTLQLVITAVNANGIDTATFEYVSNTTLPAGYTADPDNNAATAEEPWIPLGAFVSGGNTYFRIWSPDSTDVSVTIDNTEHPATLMPAFDIYTNVYECKVSGDLTGSQYQFSVGGIAVRDPYGLMVIGGKNVVMNMSGGNTGSAPALANREDSIIYEMHVRDFTIDSSWGGTVANRGKFPGMVEAGTVYSEMTSAGTKTVSTGLDHLKELGITHVQLMPVYDFGSTLYNWGYDPVNYNIPEEQYSTCPTNPTGRVDEFRSMVKEFHDNGIRVVMDVVYNHTQNNDMFSNITTKYYTGTNLSGCGNALNTGVPMVSRMIRDSLDQWISNYGIDGFRFDLLGIFHVSAVKEWGTFLNAKYADRTLLLYGEPWSGYAKDSEESLKVRYSKVQQLSDAHVGVFNGKFRDNIKGTTDTEEKGFIQGDAFHENGTAGIIVGLKGSPAVSTNPDTWDYRFTADPEQTINYASAHDNYCLWDKILYSNGRTLSTATETDRNMARFGMGVFLVSQGIPFIHGGDEILRTKTNNGILPLSTVAVRNSYNVGDDINKIRWSWKVINLDTFQSVKDLIALRKATAGMRLTTQADISKMMTTSATSNGTVSAFIDTDGTDIRLVLNPSTTSGITASDVDATWTLAWSSSEEYSVAALAHETVPASTLAVYTR